MKRYCLLACLLGCGVTEPVMVQQRSVEALNPFADLTCGTPVLPGGLTAAHFDALPIGTFEQLVAAHNIQLTAVQEDGILRGLAELNVVPITHPVIHPNGVLELPYGFKEHINDYLVWARENSDLPDDLLRFEALVVHHAFEPDRASHLALRDRYLEAVGGTITSRRGSTHERETLRCNAGCRVECRLVAIGSLEPISTHSAVNDRSECKAAGPETEDCPHLPEYYGSASAQEGSAYASCSGRFQTLPEDYEGEPTACQRVLCNRGDVPVTPNSAEFHCKRAASIQVECTSWGMCGRYSLQVGGRDFGRMQPRVKTDKLFASQREETATPSARSFSEIRLASDWHNAGSEEEGTYQSIAEVKSGESSDLETHCGGQLPEEVNNVCPPDLISIKCYLDAKATVSTSSLPAATASAGCTISAPLKCLAALTKYCLFGHHTRKPTNRSQTESWFDISVANKGGITLSEGQRLEDSNPPDQGRSVPRLFGSVMHAEIRTELNAPADRCRPYQYASHSEQYTSYVDSFFNGTTTYANAKNAARVERHFTDIYLPQIGNEEVSDALATIVGSERRPLPSSGQMPPTQVVSHGIALSCGNAGAINSGEAPVRPDQVAPPVAIGQPLCLKDNDCGIGSICECEEEDCASCECLPGCRNDSDCPDGELCQSGMCVAALARCSDCVVSEGSSDPCQFPDQCIDGRCRGQRPDEEVIYCNEAFPCCDDKICNDNECVDDPGCVEDTDCPEGQVCGAGACVDRECADDGDCPPEHHCTDNHCILDAPGCVENADCPDGEICMAGACEPPECSDGNPCPEGQRCTDFRCVLGEVGECDVPGAPVCPNNGCCRTNICHDQGSPDCQNP
jgi:hypothetical protein